MSGHAISGRLPLYGMALLLGLVAWTLGGAWGAAITGLALFVAILVLPGIPVGPHLRMLGARPLPPHHAPDLHRIVTALAARAGLPRAPEVWLMGGPPNAISVGGPDRSAIALSASLNTMLDRREMTAVLAHEIAHIAAGDVALMRFGELMNRLCHFVAVTSLLAAIWFWYMAGVSVAPDWVYWMLAVTPSAMQLLQLGLARAREYAADAAAARLTGDPEGLARALGHIEQMQRLSLGRRAREMTGLQQAPWLRTHPATPDRIGRLREMAAVVA